MLSPVCQSSQQKIVSGSCKRQRALWIGKGSSIVLLGVRCKVDSALRSPTVLSPVSGNTAGNTTRPPLPSTSFGRPWYLPGLLLLTKPTSDRIPVQVPATCCSGAPQVWSSKCNLKFSGHWSWRDYASHSMSQKQDVPVEFAWTNVADTVRVAQEAAG